MTQHRLIDGQTSDQRPDDLTLQQLAGLYRQAGADVIYLKRLAVNDNSKNQIYINSGSLSDLNLLPTLGLEEGDGPLKAPLDFYWLSLDGTLEHAPGAQLILYDQYPEVRLSGFLRGTRNAPSHLFRLERKAGAGRLLFLGITGDRRVLAFAASATSRIARELLPEGSYRRTGAFEELPFTDPVGELLQQLRDIHSAGPVSGIRFGPGGQIIENLNRNAPGVTLETLLGITANASTAPDYKGIELKAFPHAGGPVTLMTPEPTGGLYRDPGIVPFMHRFGRLDHSRDRIDFTGRHLVGVRNPSTGLTLGLAGYNTANETADIEHGAVELVGHLGEIAAEWAFTKLFDHWMRKHPRVMYVPYRKVEGKFHYGPSIYLGEETDFLFVLRATNDGAVYYDPGIKLEHVSSTHPRAKTRNQFRIYRAELHRLYKTFKEIELN